MRHQPPESGDFYVSKAGTFGWFAGDLPLEEGGFRTLGPPLRVDTDAERSKPGLTDEDDMRVRPL